MSDAAQFLADARRYAQLIESALPANPPPFAPEAESAAADFGLRRAQSSRELGRAVQVERGLVFPYATQRGWDAGDAPLVDRLCDLATAGGIDRVAVVDRAGHHRPIYRPLLVYAWLQAYRIVYETLPRSLFGRWEEGLRAWCDLLESELGQLAIPEGGFGASRGGVATEAAWTALALHVAGKVYVRDAWTDLASAAFGQLVRGQQPNGAMLRPDPSVNPEPHWYHELVLLHAAASYAVQAEDRTVAAAVARAAAYHLNETQPDHATTQPWAVFAFVWHPPAHVLADQVLHAQTVQHPAGVTGVPLMLLADALYCLRMFFV